MGYLGVGAFFSLVGYLDASLAENLSENLSNREQNASAFTERV